MVKSVLRDSILFFKRYWASVIAITLLATGAIEILSDSPISIIPRPTRVGSPDSMLLRMLLFFVSAFILQIAIGISEATVALLVYDHIQQKEVNIHSVARGVLTLLPRIISVEILGTTMILIGFLLFIVPGFVASFWLFLIMPVVAIESTRTFKITYNRSKDLVRGHFWAIVECMLAIAVPFIIIETIVGSFDNTLADPTRSPSWLGYSIIFSSKIVGTSLSAIAVAFIYFYLASSDKHSADSATEDNELKLET